MAKRKLLDQDPKLIERWMRRKLDPYASHVARLYMRPILHLRERKRIREIEKSIESILRLATRCEKEGYADTLSIANRALYLLMAELDIAFIKADALTHPKEWKRKLYIRLIVLTVFEWQINHVFGREFRASLERLGCDKSVTERLTQALSEFRNSHKKFRYRYKSYRVETIAHRTPNAISTYREIKQLSEKEVINSTVELYPSIERVLSCITDILTKYGNVEPMRKIMEDSKKH